MGEFVLIPGAWLGAWAWDDVTPLLEKAGHSAHPVTLTGMGDRAHLATPEVGMASAIDDVLTLIRAQHLGDVVLVGHSFAGKVAAAVADRIHDRIRCAIYVDGFRPERVTTPQGSFDPAGEFGPLPPGAFALPLTREIIRRIGPDVQGETLRRMEAKSTPWPTRFAKDPITLTDHYASVREAYVFCRQSGDPVEEIVAGKWGKLEGPHRIVDAGHWPMLTRPAELARDLLALAAPNPGD
jgi:pimeloyl-ACP methyl ester carboxylesterase